VIAKGGTIDRAALFMIADLRDLALLSHAGTTALHMLIDACDREIRPALIVRAGKDLLSGVFDSRGMPVIFTIFSLTDLNGDDLDAIARVFTPQELAKVMNRNRTGRNALDVFHEASERFKTHAPGERNKFFVSHAIRNTNMEGDLRTQVSSDSHAGGSSGARIHGPDQRKEHESTGSGQSDAERYEERMGNPLDNIASMMKRRHRDR
jgi:hypothetical protein